MKKNIFRAMSSSSSSSDWIKKLDPKTNRHYYVNKKLRKTQWKKPKDYVDPSSSSSSSSTSTFSLSSLFSHTHPPTHTHTVVIRREDKSGRIYYVDPVTKKSMWKCPKNAEVMSLSEFQIYRDRLRNQDSSSSSSASSQHKSLSRLEKITRLFKFPEEEDWKLLENNYDFDVMSSSLDSSSNDSSYKMTYTIETINSFGISKDFILDLQWDERETFKNEWKKMGHMYVRSTRKSADAHKSFLLAEVSFVELDKFDATRCTCVNHSDVHQTL